MRTNIPLLLTLFVAILLSACSPTQTLTKDQYMLTRNNVEVLDAHNPQFDKLKSYVRPLPNTKFMDIFNLKTSCYSAGQPKYNEKTGEYKDSRLKKWLREKYGEAPVLLDTADVRQSMSQLKIVMGQLGYFDATVDYAIVKKSSNPQKVKVNYFITAGKPYYISKIKYNIDIPEYKKIVILNQEESLLHEGMQYNESTITDELTRIINLIRNEGYYYVEKSIIRCEVAYDMPDSSGKAPNTISLEIILKIPAKDNASRYLYKYNFDRVFIQTNYDANAPANQLYDTMRYESRAKKNSTEYFFITPHNETYLKPIQDFHYRTIVDAIYSQHGIPFSQNVKRRSSQALHQLDNFNYINIEFRENSRLTDTLTKTGVLDSYYRLTRKKVHSVGGQLDLRNDKSALSLSYTNRNLFKGAEHLTINLSGGYFYYSLNNLFNKDKTFAYPEFGASASLDFPKLFLFKKVQKADAIRYSTTLNFGVNYSGLYRRLMYNTNITYNWSPNYYTNHSLSPIDLSTINNSDKRYTRILNYDDYPESYQNKFGKFLLFSLKYNFNFLVPFSKEMQNHNMRISVNYESSGLLLKGLNRLFAPDHRWVINRNSLDSTGYNYTSLEKLEFTWNYTYKINQKNAIATRMNAGCIIPIDKESFIPFEKGFYMGTSNSMRGWGYRGLGPGSYEHGNDSLFTGDIKFEWNIEYRGTLYRAIKYGLFTDIGNIWLAHKNSDMPNAEFSLNRFYKEMAIDVGVGLRLDFDFFIIRLDYALPIYDPTRTSQGRWINSEWSTGLHQFRWTNGIKLAIGYAF